MIIYKATNKINNKSYIGQTINSLKQRKKEHANDIKRFNTVFCKALRKYGKENFKWKVIEKCNSLNKLNEREKYWIKELKTQNPNGYNLTEGGWNALVPSETKIKISNKLKGRPSPNKGNKFSEELKKQIVNNRSWYKKHSPQTRKKISKALIGNTNPLGKARPQEVKDKISKTLMGHEVTEKTRKAVSLAQSGNKNRLGKKHSLESRKKMSEALKGKPSWNKGKKLSQKHIENLRKAKNR